MAGVRMRAALAAGVALVINTASPEAQAPAACRPVRGTIETAVSSCDGGSCLVGSIEGSIEGTTTFQITSVQLLGQGHVLAFTGRLTLTTSEGTMDVEQSGLANLASGRFEEHGLVTGGTGAFADVRGALNFQGLVNADVSAFSGGYVGALCPGAP